MSGKTSGETKLLGMSLPVIPELRDFFLCIDFFFQLLFHLAYFQPQQHISEENQFKLCANHQTKSEFTSEWNS